MVLESPDGLRRCIADGDQPIAGKDEADRRSCRMRFIDTAQSTYRHVERAVLLVEAARGFDLRHFRLRRHIHADALLDEPLLLFGRLFRSIQVASSGMRCVFASMTLPSHPGP